MANRTVKDAKTIKGTNPQYLIEKIIRSRIYDSKYWKEECFALTAELIVDKAMELKFLGGVFAGNIKPSPFLCLALKMLQIQPEKDIVVEFIKQDDFKYVRALGAFYMRLTGTSLDCFKYLEPLLNDYRKLRQQKRDGHFELTHMDEFIDELLREERVFDIIMPRIQKRWVHEANNELEPRVSLLEDDMEIDDEEEEVDADALAEAAAAAARALHERERQREKDRRREVDKDGRSRGNRERDRDRDRDRADRDFGRHRRSRERDGERIRDRDRDRKDRDRDRREKEKKKRSRDEERSRRTRRSRSRSDSPPSKHRRSDDRKKSSRSSMADEIAAANVLRAKLGLKPLK